MAALMLTPPELTFDLHELLKWGYIWRIGTKTRTVGVEDEEDADDIEQPEAENLGPAVAIASQTTGVMDEGAPYMAEGGEKHEFPAAAAGEDAIGAKPKKAKAKDATLTAAEAGLPPALIGIVDETKKHASAFGKKQGMDFGLVFDKAVGAALAAMLGNIPVVEYKGTAKAASLQPSQADCVEVGPARVIGGVRPQNFDVAYRPDGVRIAYDSKSLNDEKSIQKNWQNMVNDLATEATTVHTRFPYAVVAFIVALPRPALKASQEVDLIRTLERMATRANVIDQNHLAEAIALVIWDPATGTIDKDSPRPDSHLRYEKFMTKVHHCYLDRYKGLPPHDK